jgi:hypothetical protein
VVRGTTLRIDCFTVVSASDKCTLPTTFDMKSRESKDCNSKPPSDTGRTDVSTFCRSRYTRAYMALLPIININSPRVYPSLQRVLGINHPTTPIYFFPLRDPAELLATTLGAGVDTTGTGGSSPSYQKQ